MVFSIAYTRHIPRITYSDNAHTPAVPTNPTPPPEQERVFNHDDLHRKRPHTQPHSTPVSNKHPSQNEQTTAITHSPIKNKNLTGNSAFVSLLYLSLHASHTPHNTKRAYQNPWETHPTSHITSQIPPIPIAPLPPTSHSSLQNWQVPYLIPPTPHFPSLQIYTLSKLVFTRNPHYHRPNTPFHYQIPNSQFSIFYFFYFYGSRCRNTAKTILLCIFWLIGMRGTTLRRHHRSTYHTSSFYWTSCGGVYGKIKGLTYIIVDVHTASRMSRLCTVPVATVRYLCAVTANLVKFDCC